MTDWQDKYRDLEVGQSAWYWHQDEKGPKGYVWYPIKVSRKTSMQDGQVVLVARGLYHRWEVVSEDFPNGPKCLNPEEI